MDLGSVFRLAVVLNPEIAKISCKRPLRVQENWGFLVDRSCLKDSKDWLITDLGSFLSLSYLARLVKTQNGRVIENTLLSKSRQKFPKLEKDCYIVVAEHEKHCKYTDYRCATTTVWTERESKDKAEKHIVENPTYKTLNGNVEMDLGLVEFHFTGDEHSVSPKKHPIS